MSSVRPGEPAPTFSLADASGATYDLAGALERGPVALVFYPADNTPG